MFLECGKKKQGAKDEIHTWREHVTVSPPVSHQLADRFRLQTLSSNNKSQAQLGSWDLMTPGFRF
ncbi:hypothetical protein EXN66_Car007195 [Channa argus]|uniref:Uncharacterized protein n=1 Tax=Channa argus TaxID=215402 RepID=A0A6G1PMI7_CHAAH|nr:hypothetical protein EXN66_Car007195 [Channa argus]